MGGVSNCAMFDADNSLPMFERFVVGSFSKAVSESELSIACGSERTFFRDEEGVEKRPQGRCD